MSRSIIAFGDQSKQLNEGLSSNKGSFAFLGGTGIIGASGFIPYKDGRLWDRYISGIRAVETGFPSAILRTFRTSEFLSPLESWTQANINKNVLGKTGIYGDFLQETLGAAKSYNFTKTGSLFGKVTDETGKLLGYGLQVQSGSQKGAAIADYYARTSGMKLGHYDSLNDALMRTYWKLSKSSLAYKEWLETIEPSERLNRLILGSRIRNKVNILGKDYALSKSMARNLSHIETTSKYMRAYTATTVGRLNTLLAKPLEIPVIGNLLSKVPGISKMAVKPGTAMQMTARLTSKAMMVGAAWTGLEYLDYLRSEQSPWAAAFGAVAGAAVGGYMARKPGMKFSKAGLMIGAAAGLIAGIAPRFDEGLFHGAATLFTDSNVARTQLSRASGLTESLQEQERITPGLVSTSTALGFGGLGALALGVGDYADYLFSSVKNKQSGQTLADAFQKTREIRSGALAAKVFGSGLLKKLPAAKYLAKIKSPMALGFIGGIIAWQAISSGLSLASGNVMAAIPGLNLLGTTETPEELQRIYSGEEDVAVRKGRFWEFGRGSKYGGGRIDYYRPHFMERLRTRAYQKGIYGTEEERWKYDPLLNPLEAMFGSDDFKYHYEEKYQHERPAPLTSTYGEDISFIGPLVAATVGKLFKPRKLVRPEEWQLGEGKYVHRPERPELEPTYKLSGLGPGAAVSPEDPAKVFNDLNYRRREATGLVGFAEGSITKALIGREEVFPNQTTLGTMGKETGSEYWLWKHLNLGGAMGASEAIRRFIPVTPSHLETYNPLKNAMPSWMPDNYFLDFKHGNPFEKISEAEIRLPGTGYSALHPEVAGLTPEEYPLAHRVKILGDVAMWSSSYRDTLRQAKRQMNSMSKKEAALIKTTEKQVREKKKRKEFSPYVFNPDAVDLMDVNVTKVLTPSRIKTKEFGDIILDIPGIGKVFDEEKAMEVARSTLEGNKIKIATPIMESRRYSTIATGTRMKALPILEEGNYASLLMEKKLIEHKELEDEFKQFAFTPSERVIGAVSETILHGIDTPLEFLTPMSPVSKLIRQRSAIEEYEKSEAIGTSSAFWDKPIENFLKPAYNMTKYALGDTDIPENIQERRDIQEHFDMLKWTKMSRLEAKARQTGDDSEATRYMKEKGKTIFGVDVFKSPTDVMRALPRRERDFFNEFVDAKTEEERAKISQLVPENERRIYMAQWMRQEEQAAKAKRNAKIANEEDLKTIEATRKMRQSEGFEYSEDSEELWLQETGGKIPFDEWIRGKKAKEYFSTHSLPGADWLGWHSSVDLEDVKLMTVEMAGLDHHDFDLWGQRKRSLARKPYINPTLIGEMTEAAEYEDSWKIAKNSRALGKMHHDRHPEVLTSKIDADLGSDKYEFNISDGRRGLIEAAFNKLGA